VANEAGRGIVAEEPVAGHYLNVQAVNHAVVVQIAFGLSNIGNTSGWIKPEVINVQRTCAARSHSVTVTNTQDNSLDLGKINAGEIKSGEVNIPLPPGRCKHCVGIIMRQRCLVAVGVFQSSIQSLTVVTSYANVL
jgi:hypothetical protein